MVFDGKALAEKIYSDLTQRVQTLKQKGVTPNMAVVLVGDNPASKAYIAQKQKWGNFIGAEITQHYYPIETTTQQVIDIIGELNANPLVHGIIVQRPLPDHVDKNAIAAGIKPMKDIDGFHPATNFHVPVAAAVLRILEEIFKQTAHPQHTFVEWLRTTSIVTLGKGDTAGKPIADYLENLGAHPVVIDSKTSDPDTIIKQADIVITSVGKPRIISPDILKKGCILIGVGITKNEEERMVGDYDETAIANIASYYTPTPGGVGPVNVAYLLSNLVLATEIQTKTINNEIAH